MRARLRTEEGFGLIELMISIVMLNVGILALVAAFNSGALALQRAVETSTAAALAEKQMELYRARKYAEIALDATLVGDRAAATRPTSATTRRTRSSDRAPDGGREPADAAAKTCRVADAAVQPAPDGHRPGRRLVPHRHATSSR